MFSNRLVRYINRMRCLLIVCAIFTLSQAAPTLLDPYAEDMKHKKVIALECIDKVQINRTIIEEAMRDPLNLPTDPKYKEFLACSYKKQQFQSNNGKMLYDNIYDFLSRYYEREDLHLLDDCKNVTAANDGEMAFNSLKCITQHLKTMNTKSEDLSENSI